MGLRGPAPAPTEILRLKGTRKDRINDREPRPEKGRPETPDHLTAEQKAVWRRLCKLLEGMRVLTKADGAQLERYVAYLLRWRECEAFVQEAGSTYPIKAKPADVSLADGTKGPGPAPAAYITGPLDDGSYVTGFGTYPQARMSLELDKALKQIEQNYGLTPSARTRIAAAAAKPETSLDAFREALG